MQIVSNRLTTGSRVAVVLRASASVAALAGVAAVLATTLVPLVDTVQQRSPSAAELLTVLAAALGLVLTAWLLIVLLLEVLALAPGAVGSAASALALAVTPRMARHVVLFVLGVGFVASCGPSQAIAAAPASVSVAETVDGPPTTEALPAPGWLPALAPATTDLPEPGWVPSAPPPRASADPTPLIGAPQAAHGPLHHVVISGETLWSIAAEHLPPAATDTEIAEAWPRWYAANRHTIGDDPDLILPGQILTAPLPLTTGTPR